MKFDKSIYDGIELEVQVDDRQGFDSSIHPVFSDIISEVKPKIIVEAGSWKGVSACNMASLAGPDCTIYCVDTFLGGADQMRDDLGYNFPRYRGYPAVYFQFLANVKRNGFHNQIIPIPNTSSIGAILLKRAGVFADIAYVDGSHEGRDAYHDLIDYWELVRPGGYLIFDDFPLFVGTYAAAWRFNDEKGLAKEMKLTPNKNIAYWKKP